jgi:hypothetical protein
VVVLTYATIVASMQYVSNPALTRQFDIGPLSLRAGRVITWLCHKILMTSGLIRCGLITSFLSSYFLPGDKRVKSTDSDGCAQTRGFEGRKDCNEKTFCVPVCSVSVTPLHKLTVFRNMGPSTVADGRRLEYGKLEAEKECQNNFQWVLPPAAPEIALVWK